MVSGSFSKWVQVYADGFSIGSSENPLSPLRQTALAECVVCLLICITFITATLVAVRLHNTYFDRTNLPDIEPFTRFEFPTISRVYDANGQPLIEMAREYQRNIKYDDKIKIHM